MAACRGFQVDLLRQLIIQVYGIQYIVDGPLKGDVESECTYVEIDLLLSIQRFGRCLIRHATRGRTSTGRGQSTSNIHIYIYIYIYIYLFIYLCIHLSMYICIYM